MTLHDHHRQHTLTEEELVHHAHSTVRWTIRDGLLRTKAHRGWLPLDALSVDYQGRVWLENALVEDAQNHPPADGAPCIFFRTSRDGRVGVAIARDRLDPDLIGRDHGDLALPVHHVVWDETTDLEEELLREMPYSRIRD